MQPYHLLDAVVGGSRRVHPPLGMADERVCRVHRVTMVTGRPSADEVAATGSGWVSMRRRLKQWHPQKWEKPRGEIRARLSECGINHPIRQFWDELDDITLVFISRSFQLAAETFEQRSVFTGPGFIRPLDPQRRRPGFLGQSWAG